MQKKSVIKIAITLGVIIVFVIILHLVGNSLFPMIKNHMGM